MNEEAAKEFMANTLEAKTLLQIIETGLVDQLRHVESEYIHWGHVGDSMYVLESLRDIARFLGYE